MRRNRESWLFSFMAMVYAVCMTYAVWLGISQPFRNWDMLGYLGSVMSWMEGDQATLYARVMRSVELQIPDWIVSQFRANPLSGNAEAFVQQIPFYQVKPLYNFLLFALYLCGVPLPTGTWIISSASFAGLAILLYLMRPRYLPRSMWLGLVLALSFFGELPLRALAQFSTPDALATLLCVLTLYSWVWKRSLTGFYVSGLLAMLARPDALILIAAWGGYFSLLAPRNWRLPLLPTIIYGVGLVLLHQLVAYLAGSYGWEKMFIYAFFNRTPYPAQMTDQLTLDGYLWLMPQAIQGFLTDARVLILLNLCWIGCFGYAVTRREGNNLWLGLLLITLLALALRFALFPVPGEARYYYAYFIVMLFAAAELAFPFLLWIITLGKKGRTISAA